MRHGLTPQERITYLREMFALAHPWAKFVIGSWTAEPFDPDVHEPGWYLVSGRDGGYGGLREFPRPPLTPWQGWRWTCPLPATPPREFNLVWGHPVTTEVSDTDMIEGWLVDLRRFNGAVERLRRVIAKAKRKAG